MIAFSSARARNIPGGEILGIIIVPRFLAIPNSATFSSEKFAAIWEFPSLDSNLF
jgi:hypothetical protein